MLSFLLLRLSVGKEEASGRRTKAYGGQWSLCPSLSLTNIDTILRTD